MKRKSLLDDLIKFVQYKEKSVAYYEEVMNHNGQLDRAMRRARKQIKVARQLAILLGGTFEGDVKSAVSTNPTSITAPKQKGTVSKDLEKYL